MSFRNSHRVKWLPATLATLGIIILALGIWVALVTITGIPVSLHNTGLPFQRAVYVGTNACFTCHSDQKQDWSSMRYDLSIGDDITRPLAWDTDVRRIAVVGSLNTYTTKNGKNRAPSPNDSQRYIVKTEYGQVLLPA